MLVFLGGEEYRWPALLTVLVLLLLIAGLLWPLLRQSALLRFSLLGATLSVIPFCAIINQDRVALIPGIGFSLAIAEVILRGFAAGQLLRGFAALLMALHLMLSPLLLFAESAYISANARHTRANLLQLADSDLDGKRVVLLKGSVSQSALLRPVRRLQGVAEPESVWLLSGGRDLLQITRVGDRGVVARHAGGGGEREAAGGVAGGVGGGGAGGEGAGAHRRAAAAAGARAGARGKASEKVDA